MGDDGDAAAAAIFGQRSARVAVEGLLDERDVELFERREGGERFRVGPPHVGVDADRNQSAHRFTHRAHPIDVLLRFEAGLDLDVVESLVEDLSGHIAGPFGWTADDELDGDTFAHAPAPQLRKGQAGRLARDVPQRHLDRRLGVGIGGDDRVHAIQRPLDMQRLVPFERRGKKVVDAVPATRQVLARPYQFERRLAETFDPFVGTHDHDHEASRGNHAVGGVDAHARRARNIHGNGFNLANLHVCLLSGINTRRRPSCVRDSAPRAQPGRSGRNRSRPPRSILRRAGRTRTRRAGRPA